MEFIAVTCGFVILLVLLYRYLTATFNFWKERGVPGPDPIPIFGTIKNIVLLKEFYGTYWKRIYDTYEDAQFVGTFQMREPVLVIKDPKHIKDISIKDSLLFSTRGLSTVSRAEPLQLFIFNLDGPEALAFRTNVSQIFTPSKLKTVFKMMQESTVRLDKYMDSLLMKSDCVNCHDVTARFTADIIGNFLMGIDMKTLSSETNKEDPFITSIEFFRGTRGNRIFRKILSDSFPQLYNLIGYRLFHNDKLTNFYMDFFKNQIASRKKQNIVKSDFIGLLMNMKDNPGRLAEIMEVTDYFYAAQLFGFFYGGYETSSTTITNTLYELALNQNIQNKLRDEVLNVYAHHGEFTYDNINSMVYLSSVVKETIRKYPLADSLIRKSTSSYTFRDTSLTIPKGQKIVIPVYAIHHDPKIYPNPEVYDPERFSNEAVLARDPMHYIPFGYGARNCIGKQLGTLQTKVGLIAFLRKYKVNVCEKTITSYKYHLLPVTLVPADPIYLKVTKLD